MPAAAARLLYAAMSPRRRRHFVVLLAAMVGAAAAEMLAIAAVLPFVGAIAGTGDPAVPRALGGASALLGVTALLAVAIAAAALMRLLLMWLSQRFALLLGHDIGTAIFGRMLRQPYSSHLNRNSSEILSGVEKIQTMVASILLPLVQTFVAAVIAAGIVALLVLISPLATGVAAAFVGSAYLAASVVTRGRLQRNSARLARLSRERIKAVQEALGGIRDILLDRSQGLFEARFRSLDARFRRAQAENLFLAGAPRHLIEAAGIGAVALIALAMSGRPGGIAAALPVLAALALGAQKLLPLVQQAYFGWSQATGHFQALADIVALLELPQAEEPPRGGATKLQFERDIVFDDVSFDYGAGAPALRGVSLRIARGARFGIAGRTGSGKSTLLDLLMGLIGPDSGEIRIDGQRLEAGTRAAWQARLAHVPQSVYLLDDSIAANIAFGLRSASIDGVRLRSAARLAQLDVFVESLPAGYDTMVGERGIRLSGGERQRIGIARALYKQAELLILDEATSALDDETEAAVMAAIDSLGDRVTVVTIAHRQSTLAGCDAIVRLDHGRVVEMSLAEPVAVSAG